MAFIVKIISGALAGTSLMTALSYTLAYLFNKQFKEPVLLNMLLRRSHFYEGRHVWPGFGWLIHYGVGIILVISYHFIWVLTIVNPTVTSGSLLDLASGLVGVAKFIPDVIGSSFIYVILTRLSYSVLKK